MIPLWCQLILAPIPCLGTIKGSLESPNRANQTQTNQNKENQASQPATMTTTATITTQLAAAPAVTTLQPVGTGMNEKKRKRTNSHKDYQNLPYHKISQLSLALQNESVIADKMNSIVDILRDANELPSLNVEGDDGWVELELGSLSPHTLWSLYELMECVHY
jgi:hypothetical protein